MQLALEQVVRQRTPHYLRPGEVVPYTDSALPYRAILHAVAIDAWYDSTPAIIEQTVATALTLAAEFGAKRVALAALATGYGHLSLSDFAAGVRPLVQRAFPPIEEVCICMMDEDRVAELSDAFTEATRIPPS